MFSDADPAVARDPKQQHRVLTKLGIYAGIPVAVFRLPKTSSALCIALIFLEDIFSPVFFMSDKQTKKIPTNVIFLSSKLQQSVLLLAVRLKPEI